MLTITRQKYFYYIAFMLMASAYLRVVFYNFPPFVGSHHIWTLLWGLSLIYFYPKLILSKPFLFVLIYGVLFFLATKTIWSNLDDMNSVAMFMELYEIAVGVSVITYFLKSRDFIGLAKICKWTLVFIFISAIMTLISSSIDPMYARNIVGASLFTDLGEKARVMSFSRLGGGNYSTAGAYMCLLPILVYLYKHIRISLLSKKVIFAFIILLFLALIRMQIFAYIILAIAFTILAMLGLKKIRQSIFLIIIFFFFSVAIPKDTYTSALINLSEKFAPGSDIRFKLGDVAVFIKTGADIYDNSTATGGRAERYPLLAESFSKSPILGCYFLSDKSGNGYVTDGVHLYWMNKLTITGIVGLFFFLIIPYKTIKYNLGYFNSEYKYYYLLASLTILSYGFMKTLAGRETWYAFFILLPGLYYLPLLKHHKNPRSLQSKDQDLLLKKNK